MPIRSAAAVFVSQQLAHRLLDTDEDADAQGILACPTLTPEQLSVVVAAASPFKKVSPCSPASQPAQLLEAYIQTHANRQHHGDNDRIPIRRV